MKVIVIHEHRYGNTPYGIDTECKSIGELMSKIGDDQDLAESLGIDYNPDTDSLSLIDFDEIEEFVKL